jgi:iron complex outermembrane receptor protein
LLTPQVAGAIAAANFPGVPLAALQGNPAFDGAVAAVVGGLAGVAGGGYAQGQLLIPAAALPVFGTINSQRAPNDGLAHLAAGYQKFNDLSRTHWGMDAAAEYFMNENVSIWANASYLSQNVWIPGEDDDDGLPFSSYLNAPQFKYRAGIKYSKDRIQGAISFQHDDEFESNQGFWSGTVQEKNLIDANFGVKLTDKFRFDVTASNLFNQQYRAFPNMPIIGRRVIGKLTFDL